MAERGKAWLGRAWPGMAGMARVAKMKTTPPKGRYVRIMLTVPPDVRARMDCEHHSRTCWSHIATEAFVAEMDRRDACIMRHAVGGQPILDAD